MKESATAVFLSYASQDAAAARSICGALRAAGLVVWFDQSELRGGDAWDALIRKQVKECALFVPIISANTDARSEGYFRREWNLAVHRMMDMADDRAFLLPVVIDQTIEASARVPDRFRERQWTRLPRGEADENFAGHVMRLLARGSDPEAATTTPIRTGMPAAPPARADADERFWVAVLPFKCGGTSADLAAFSEGLAEGIVAGMSRFSYLRIIARRPASPDTRSAADQKELRARYVIEGSLRQSGTNLRLAVQLVDAVTGAHLWAENYARSFDPEAVFELHDELVPRIVSTVADQNGVLARSMSDSLRSRDPDQLTPYEAVLRSFGYAARGTAEELASAQSCLELAVRKAPAHADAWAMLSALYVQDYAHGFNLQTDALTCGLRAAQQAVELAPANHLANASLAQALFFRREFQQFRNAAERAIALNPMDGNSIAFLGELLTYGGNPARGLDLSTSAKQLNPHHPGWYWYADFYDSYGRGDYRAALAFALNVNLPNHWFSPASIAAACGQLGETDAAAKAWHDLLGLRPDFLTTVRNDIGKWWEPAYVEHLIDGWRKAGLNIA